MAVIELNSVSWRRDSQNILQNINWKVEYGEHWAIIGVNGSGKTSLLNLVNGYTWPTTGSISVLGNTFGKVDLATLRRSIGWVSSSLSEKITQTHANDCALDVVLSGKYASIGIWVHTTEQDKSEATSVLRTFHCEHLSKKPFHILSQGEKQRILIARAWMARPKILILDEPCTGLDIKNRELLLSTIDHLSKQKSCPTLLYVTHHVEEVLPWFNRALVLKEGSTLSCGDKTEVISSHTLTQAFDIPIEVIWKSGRPWAYVTDIPHYE